MQKFIVTFGSGQLGGFGLHYHLEVSGPDEMTVRRVVSEMFDKKWGGIYAEPSNYVARYGTKCLGRVFIEDVYSWRTERS
jgi:hypothetical protein